MFLRCAGARRCAAVSISGAKSLVISSPPGWISSYARYPVSPRPAASSRIVCPGWGWIASTIAALNGHRVARELVRPRLPALGGADPAVAGFERHV